MTLSLEQRIANLSPEKRALLEKRLRQGASQSQQITTIPLADRAKPLPLSFSQQRLWFLDQLQPDSIAYNNIALFRLRGTLRIAALQQSLDEILRRHEVLRTTYTLVDGEPRQLINPPLAWSMQVVDLGDLQGEAQRQAVEQQIKTAYMQPFDLANDPMRRAYILKFNPIESILIITGHHIASDGWSNAVFWRELSALYNALVAIGPSPFSQVPLPKVPVSQTLLPPLPLQYADYALWQRQMLQGEKLEKLLGYWRNQLADLPQPFQLPVDFPRNPETHSQGKRWHFQLPASVSEPLKLLAREKKTTLFMTLLAAFQVLLMRYSNQTDIVVGTPIANRQHPELEGLIGIFVNTLVLRSRLEGNPSFLQLLEQIRITALGAFEHQDLPFEKLVEALHPDRDRAINPLFQVMFALQNTPRSNYQLEGLEVERLPTEIEATKFDLQLALNESASGLEGRFEYNSALFLSSTIERMAAHFATLIESIIANPTCPIGQLPIISTAERNQILYEWHQSASTYPANATIHHLFTEIAGNSPDAVALHFEDSHFSYQQLQQRANQFANLLLANNVQMGDVVAIAADRSAMMVVAMLAVLKTGAAYLPLDVTQPTERLRHMLDDAQVSIVIGDGTNLPAAVDSQRIYLNLEQSWDKLPTAPVSVTLSSEAPAYVIYTSGSTGEPKGVVIPHRAVLRLVCNTNYITITPQDGIAQASNPMFDAATFEIWGALLNGACLVGVTTETLLSPTKLSSHLNHHNISILFVTTALFHRIAAIAPETFQTLRLLLFGGETSDPQWVRRVLEKGQPRQLLHVYGPTENCTFSTFYPVNHIDENAVTIPIGKPIANCQLYILDSHLQPVPVGVSGELHLGGDGLAHGYLHQPQLSAEKFISNPFGSGLLYKTGDIARYLPDGNIEFIGRSDFQVKIRGFRVELGEVESAIHRHLAVKEAVVLTVSQGMGEKQMLAYIVPHAPSGVVESEIEDFLKQRLPSYMIPAEMVILDALPLNNVGKVDRNALQQIRRQVTKPSPPTTARDSFESQLVEIWESVLNKKPIGVLDNFFDLGGHSLLAIQLFDRIAKLTGQTLPLATLFQTPTIEALATALRRQDWSPNWNTLVPIRPEGSLPPLFVIPPGASTVLRFAPMLNHLDAELPIYGLQHRGLEDAEEPLSTVEEIAAYFVEAILRLQPEGPYLLAGICFGAHVALEVAQQLTEQQQRVPFLAVLDAAPPSNGPDWSRRTYIFLRVQWHIERLRVTIQRGDWSTYANHYFSTTKKLLQKKLFGASNSSSKQAPKAAIVRDTHLKAQMSFHARTYPGHLLLMQSEEYSNKAFMARRWRKVAPENFECIVIRGTTHNTLLRTEHHLNALSCMMRDAIDRAIGRKS